MVVWFQGCLLVDRIAERIVPDEHLACCPNPDKGVAEQDADLQVDIDQIRRDQLAVDDRRRG